MILNNLLKIFILIENKYKITKFNYKYCPLFINKIMNKKLKIIILICLFIILFVLWILLFPQKVNQSVVIFKNKTFQVELAQTEEERQIWLMYRENLDENKWMLFVFPTEWIYGFWMKNTLISLDMIRINQIDWENRVVDIQTAAPCTTIECETYVPNWVSKYVLEINAWLAEKYGIKVWDLMYIE